MAKMTTTLWPSQADGRLTGRLSDPDRKGRLHIRVTDVARAAAALRCAEDELAAEVAAARRQGQDELVAEALADLESRRVRS